MSNFKEIKIRITKNTAEDLQEISEKSGLGIGEVVDRLTTKYSSTDPDDALYLAIDDILVITSKLSQEDSQKVIGNIAGSLLFLLPQDKMEEIVEKAESKRKAIMEALDTIDDEKRKIFFKMFFSDHPIANAMAQELDGY